MCIKTVYKFCINEYNYSENDNHFFGELNVKKDEKKPIYVLCPRCELNYIGKKDKYCTICKAELGLVDPSILIPDEEEAGIEKLCPVCQVNYIAEDEEICFLCQKEREDKDGGNEEDWENSVTPDDSVVDDEIEITLVGEFDEEDEQLEESIKDKEPDDFNFDVDPDDFIQDEEEEEEDEDEDEDF